MVSIIIPFYNAAHFLEKAILSALHQIDVTFEIVLINDGSTDSSVAIAKQYSDQHQNVRLFTTLNIGPGHARNLGVRESVGEFVVFLDSDDTLEPLAVKTMLDCISKDQTDIVICQFTMYDKQQQSFKEAGWWLDSTKVNSSLAVQAMYDGGIASVVWAKLYRKTVIDHILFPEAIWFEDRPYLMECFLNTGKISFTEKSLINVFSRDDSITRKTVTKKRIVDLHLIYELEIEILKKYNKLDELSQYIINHHVDVLLDTFFLLLLDQKKINQFNDYKKVYITYVNKFENHYKEYPHMITHKRRLILILLYALKIVPWNIVALTIRLIFRKKYRGIMLLKNK